MFKFFFYYLLNVHTSTTYLVFGSVLCGTMMRDFFVYVYVYNFTYRTYLLPGDQTLELVLSAFDPFLNLFPSLYVPSIRKSGDR